jgi:putative ABC transport system permease protein
VNLAFLAANNLRRNKLRSALTLAGVAVAILAFVLLRTVTWAWTVQSTDTQNDRIVTRHKVTFVMSLPRRYVDEVRDMKEVRCATWANWFGGKDPNHDTEFFATLAVDDQSFFEVYDDMKIAPEQLAAFKADRQGAVVGDKLLKRLGWHVGQTITLTSQIFSGEYEFHIVGGYEALKKSIDPAQVVFHWDVLNERLRSVRKQSADKVGWIVARVAPGKSAVDTSLAIDSAFDVNDIQTLSQDERSFQASFLGMFSAILTALDIVSFVILGIMMLILGNTVAMGVRERTGEYAVLRAIGFRPYHIVVLVVGEAGTLGLLGGGIGLALAYPFINMGMGRYIEENYGNIFPFFHITPGSAGVALALAFGLGITASIIPAARAYRLHVIDALRRVA